MFIKRNFVAAVTLAIAFSALAADPAAVEKYLGVLKSDASTRQQKHEACRHLAVIGDKSTVPVLAGFLDDPEMNHMARYALETLQDPSVDQAFRDALPKLKGRPLVGVIGSIGVRKDATAVDALAKYLADSDADVAQAAARSLGKIATPQAVQAIEPVATTAGPNQMAACEGLFRAAETLVASGNTIQGTAIYEILRAAAVPHQVKAGAIRGNILARGEAGHGVLKQALAEKDYKFFAAAVGVTHEMKDKAVTAILVDELKNLPAEYRVIVIDALGIRRDATALPALLAAAGSGEKIVRLPAIRAAAAIADPSTAPAFIQIMSEQDPDITAAAKEAFASLPGQQVDQQIQGMFNSNNADQQLLAMELIARRQMTQMTPAIAKAAKSGDAKIRPAAIRMLGEMSDDVPGALDILMTAEKGDIGAAEQTVVSVINRSGKPHVATVAALLPTADADRKASLLRVLGSIGSKEALDEMRKVLADKNSDAAARSAAIRVLGNWKTSAAAPDLLELAKSAENPTEKILSLRAYIGIIGRSEATLDDRLKMCKTVQPLITRAEEKRLFLASLATVETPDAMDMIVGYLDDAATKEEAAAAAVAFAEKFLRGREKKPTAVKIIEPLNKAAAATANDAVARRARALAGQAKARAEQK